MGGRGASSGVYILNKKRVKYGGEYHTVLQYRNIKFVKINKGSNTAPMETMTNGRVYVTVGNNDSLKSITYYSASGKRKKQIDLDHLHNVDGEKTKPHVHLGYNHNEIEARQVNKIEKRMVARVLKIWNNRGGS